VLTEFSAEFSHDGLLFENGRCTVQQPQELVYASTTRKRNRSRRGLTPRSGSASTSRLCLDGIAARQQPVVLRFL
jgi:hypothetical protein